MKKYKDNDVVVGGLLDVDISVEEVLENMWEVSGDNLEWNVEDELKDWKKSFKNGKKYVVRGYVGSRGYYEGLEVIREGSVLYEKDLIFGSDFWMLRLVKEEELKEDLEDGSYSREEYDELIKLYREGSNEEVFVDSLCGCVNVYGGEFNEEESFYYYVVDRLRQRRMYEIIS